MKRLYICKTCGNIVHEDESIKQYILDRNYNCSCNSLITMENSYPPLNCNDFIFSMQDLLENSKMKDKNNLEGFHNFLIDNYKILIDKTKADSYLSTYEKIREKYPDNDRNFFLIIYDEFEKVLSRNLNDYDMIDSILSCIVLFDRNRFRKPIILIVASLIELLFNNFFKILVESTLSSYGSTSFLKKYEFSGVQSCIDICNSFLDENLNSKMDKFVIGFYNKWETLRKLRNNIIHNNTTYISKTKVLKSIKLVDESIIVFSSLIVQIYKDKNYI